MTIESSGEKTVLNLKLAVGNKELEATVSLPRAAIRPVDVLPILQSFDDAVMNVLVEEVQQQGKTVSCKAGCGACCRQLVPITDTEARYLAELVAEMPDDQRAHVEDRFRTALAELEKCGMLDRLRDASELSELESRRQLGMDYFDSGIPCPLLENESCSIHSHRPLTCREYLVTSPPQNCSHPLPQQINRVAVPVMFSKVLSRFGDGVGRRPARWLPLVMALEWVANQGDSDQPRVPAPEMFNNFLRLIAASSDRASLEERPTELGRF
jgi:Fe-S-cluster containining protein